MIKTLLTAAALALSLTAAHAAQPQIPAEYRGWWCQDTSHPYLMPWTKAISEDCEVTFLVTATTWQNSEDPQHVCKLTSIKSVFVDKVNLPEGVFTCRDSKFRFTFTTGSGSMGYKAGRIYTEDLR